MRSSGAGGGPRRCQQWFDVPAAASAAPNCEAASSGCCGELARRDKWWVSQPGLERRPVVTYQLRWGAWLPDSSVATWGHAAPSR